MGGIAAACVLMGVVAMGSVIAARTDTAAGTATGINNGTGKKADMPRPWMRDDGTMNTTNAAGRTQEEMKRKPLRKVLAERFFALWDDDATTQDMKTRRQAMEKALIDNNYSAFVDAVKPTQEEFTQMVEAYKAQKAEQDARKKEQETIRSNFQKKREDNTRRDDGTVQSTDNAGGTTSKDGSTRPEGEKKQPVKKHVPMLPRTNDSTNANGASTK